MPNPPPHHPRRFAKQQPVWSTERLRICSESTQKCPKFAYNAPHRQLAEALPVCPRKPRAEPMNVPCFASERTQTHRVHRKNNTFRGTPWRHCRRSQIQWQLPSHLVRPRNGSARQRCASPESLTASVTTIKLDVQRRTTRRPSPIGDRGSKPPANFRPFPSLERGPPEA